MSLVVYADRYWTDAKFFYDCRCAPFQERKLAAKMKLSQMEAELSAASDQLKALKESERSRKAMSVRSGHKSHL